MIGRHVLLTGGTGTLGMAVAEALLERGAALTITYRTEREHVLANRRLEPNEHPIRYVAADLIDETAVAETIIEMERVDILVHCVGAFEMRPLHLETIEGWRDMLDINLTSAFLTCKHALLRMLEQGYGRIVTIAARNAYEPSANTAAYAAAKAGLIALTKAIAEETKGRDITANAVAPSIIDTPSNRAALGAKNADKWTRLEALAQTVCYLASEAARALRGTVVTDFGNP